MKSFLCANRATMGLAKDTHPVNVSHEIESIESTKAIDANQISVMRNNHGVNDTRKE
jgi:hypothetical protein